MRIPHTGRTGLALLATAWLAVSCAEQKLQGLPSGNQRPSLEISQAPAPADTLGTYVYELSWAAFDTDGSIDHFLYVVDPPSALPADTAWVMTKDNRRTFVFRADSVSSGGATRARGFHTVAVVAVDDEGARSNVAHASFTVTTVTPTVGILSPPPSSLLEPVVPPSITVNWVGTDPDGMGSREPVSYRWKLLTQDGEFPRLLAIANPESLRVRYAPDFEGWESVPGNVTSATMRNLTPGQSYTFVVVAIDQASAYSPVFNLSTNMLSFRIGQASEVGPILSISSPVFSYTYPSGGFHKDPATWVKIELPADMPIQFAWSAKPTSGSFIAGYRWAVDLASLDDETPREDEVTDIRRWSRWSTTTSVTLPPVSPSGGATSEAHLFYLQVRDDIDQESLAIIQYNVIRAAFDRELLVVDDTWFNPDRAGTGGCVLAPSAVWPTAAELDTLMYAIGDKPYRCYPTGTRSPAGLLAGYSFDTLATHLRPPGTISVQLLSRYRHVIWMCDLTSALSYESDPFIQTRPMPLMRWWSMSGVQNPLRTWLLQGGRMWLMGGGAAYASLRPYDAARSPNNVFSRELGELVQGRLMYDAAHWRSELTVLFSARAQRAERAVPDWPGAPDYSLLPPLLAERTLATDPLPPLRANLSWPSTYAAEYLTKPNEVYEYDPPDPSTGTAYAAVDTLYETQGGQAGTGRPVMTLYHGRENGRFVFSGFPIWYFQKSQAIGVVDFVLQNVWGMTRKPIPR